MMQFAKAVSIYAILVVLLTVGALALKAILA